MVVSCTDVMISWIYERVHMVENWITSHFSLWSRWDCRSLCKYSLSVIIGIPSACTLFKTWWNPTHCCGIRYLQDLWYFFYGRRNQWCIWMVEIYQKILRLEHNPNKSCCRERITVCWIISSPPIRKKFMDNRVQWTVGSKERHKLQEWTKMLSGVTFLLQQGEWTKIGNIACVTPPWPKAVSSDEKKNSKSWNDLAVHESTIPHCRIAESCTVQRISL